MHAFAFRKYAFRIRTRDGLAVSNLMIHGRDEEHAQRKLRQIYRDCEIMECICHHGSDRTPPANFEDVLRLIAR
ncbi:MAG TPA: hypothetical protein VMV91_08280 [Rhodocyclaceae bacterium]|nr:hypothetical protein [Rhodocyclaceae bacterium]